MHKLLAALTAIHEQPLDYPAWGLTGVLLREFTARERQYAQEAVQAEAGEADVDQILFRAMLIQRCITDPATGRPYADGRPGPDGSPAIDPRTRTPIFTVEEIQEIADGRAIIFNHIWDDLLALAAAAPADLFRGDHEDVSSERDARASTGGDAAEPDRPPDQGAGDTDGRTEVHDRAEQGTIDTP
jgi:hypothetical protein